MALNQGDIYSQSQETVNAVVTNRATPDHLQNPYWLLCSGIHKLQSSRPLLDPSWVSEDIITIIFVAMSLCWTVNTFLLP